MTRKNKKNSTFNTSTDQEDIGASSTDPPTSTASSTDVLVQMLQQQQQQFMQQQQQFMQQQQQMAQILANFPAMQQGTPITQASTSTTTTPSTSIPKAQIQSPDKLRLDATLRGAQEWKMKWSEYATIIDLHTFPQPKQFAVLRLCLDDEVLRILDHTLGVKPDSTLPVEDIIDRIISHIRDQRNESLRRLEFTNCKQHPGEKFDAYWVRLKQIADDIDLCKGSDCVDNQLKHAILVGLRDNDTVQHLLRLKADTSLSDLLTAVRSREAAQRTSDAIQQEYQPASGRLNAVSTYKKNKKQQNLQNKQEDPSVKRNHREETSRKKTAYSKFCYWCGGDPHPKNECPAKEVKCSSCNKKGHFAKVCLKSQGKQAKQPSSSKWNGQKHGNVLSLTSNANVRAICAGKIGPPCPTIPLTIMFANKQGILDTIPDSGSNTTVIGQQHLQTLGIKLEELDSSEELRLRNPDDSDFNGNVLGSMQSTMTYGEKSVYGWINVMSHVSKPLLSWSHAQGLGILPKDYPQQIPEIITNGNVQHIQSILPLIPTTPPLRQSSELIKSDLLQEFSDVLLTKDDLMNGVTLKKMNGPPMRIHVRDNAKPLAIHTARQVSPAWQEDVKKELQTLVAQGIIMPAGDRPSVWCHPMAPVEKPKGGVRITVDMSKLNSQVDRPTHPSLTPKEAVRLIDREAKYFTTFDALQGYWQIPLAEEDRHLTTFITPLGRFMFCRGPMGLCSTGDEYNRRGDEALSGIPNLAKVVDDIIICDKDLVTHIQRIKEVLKRCRAHGITLNADKMCIASAKVSLCGYTISEDGIAASKDKVRAITEFPTPSNITDLRSFMGLVNQLAEFTPDIASTANVLRPLLSPRNSFQWTPDHDAAFKKTKEALAKSPILAHFDHTLPTMLQTDASRLNGIGYALLQEHDGVWRLVQCGSRFLADVETRYSTIELEMLAVVWAMNKCKYYLLGLPQFMHITDHKPLIPVLNSYTLDFIENPRLQRLREKISRFVFKSSWRKGKELCIPDALSRAPVDTPKEEDTSLGNETSVCMRNAVVCSIATLHNVSATTVYNVVTTNTSTSDLILEELRRATTIDKTYKQLIEQVIKGFPQSREALPEDLLPFWKVRDQLSVDENLVLYGARILIPQALRRQVLTRLHDSHRGIEATKRRARQTVWWPSINNDIANVIRACQPCQVLLPSQQKEPYLLNTDAPTRPFESVSADFFSVAGKSYLVYADRYSGWPAVGLCGKDTTTSNTISLFRTFFRDLGVPIRLRTDGGPQFTSHDFSDFLKRWGVIHDLSSPHYPQSNGHAESAVKAVKHLIMKVSSNGDIRNCEDFDRGLLEIRNTPRPDGRSPAQILYGKSLRSCVPAHAKSFAPEWQKATEDWDRQAAARFQHTVEQYNKSAKSLPPIPIGDFVRIQNHVSKRWDKVGKIMGRGRNRDYLVKTVAGGVLWRNRRFLRTIPTPNQQCQDNEPTQNQFTDTLQASTHRNAYQSAPRRSARLSIRP